MSQTPCQQPSLQVRAASYFITLHRLETQSKTLLHCTDMLTIYITILIVFTTTDPGILVDAVYNIFLIHNPRVTITDPRNAIDVANRADIAFVIICSHQLCI
ncbi:hypothetical protein Natoc_2286 [Natronococcus occultus SP4]|uniref:Uncharacterized protein n=1 Tax=Natronococcus occultus SP4 TaxID=694430 RepID=L0K132_9EURY|nr:hypothetical protein Natoc_2286 [Natronococcus occultus SP4]